MTPEAKRERPRPPVVELYTDESTLCIPTFEVNGQWVSRSVVQNQTGGDWSNGTPYGPPTVSAPACSCPSGFSFVGWSGSYTIACLED